MTVSHKQFTAVVLAAMAIMSPVWAQTPEEIQKIEKAVPAKATAKPKKERRVLVFSLALKYKHSAIPYGEQALKIMGDKTGAFQVDLSQDMEDLRPENLEKYDAIVFNNTTGDFVTTDTVKEGLLQFVRSGKGIVGIHAASDSNFSWPEYGRLIGGFFQNHPWRASDTVTIKIERPKHPLMKAFDEKTFTVNDEIYQFREPYSRDNLLVLASLDTEKTDMNKEGITRTDNDFAISWVQPYGKGRVFYCSLGHNHHIFWNETILQHYLDGIQFALGDLKAPHRPNKGNKGGNKGNNRKGGGAETETVEAGTTMTVTMDDVEEAFEALRGYDFGTDRAFMLVLDEAIRQSAGKQGQRNRIATAFAEVAADDTLTFAAREAALRRLGEMGEGRQVQTIAKILQSNDDKLAERARQAIEAIPGQEANRALLDALDKATGPLKIGVMHALGNRQVKQAITPLTEIARGSNADEARAALKALGDIANGEAARALDELRPADEVKEAWLKALNDAAATLADKNKRLSERLYNRVMQSAEDSPARLAAFKGLAVLSGQPEAMALKTLDENNAALAQVARELLVRGKSESITTQLQQRLANASGEKKIAVIEILGARGDKSVLPDITALAEQADDKDVQIAALRALESLGDEKVVALLVKVAADSTGAVANAAETTLKDMPVPEVDAEVRRLANEAPSPDEQVVAIEAVAARKSPDAMPDLIKATASDEPKVAIAAFKATGDVLTYRDLPPLLKAHSAVEGERVLREGSRAVIAAARHYKKREDAVKHVEKAFNTAPGDEVKASLLGVLGDLGTTKSLQILRDNLASSNEELKEAAVRGLASFPDSDALDDLLKIASESESEVYRVLAIRGIARLLAESKGSAEERLAMANKVLALDTGAEGKKAIIGALGELKIPGVLPLILPFVDQENLKEEAVAAILEQAPVANAFNPAETAELLNPLSDKLERPQWEKLEEALTPSEESAAAIRAWQATELFRADGETSIGALLEREFAPETGEGEWTNAVWGGIDEDGDEKGQVDLASYYPESESVVVYLRQHVWSPDERKVELQTGSDDGLRAFLNGEQVFAADDKRGFKWWGDKTPVTLNRGWNTLVLKVANGNGDYTVAARIVDEEGNLIQDLKYSAVPPAE